MACDTSLCIPLTSECAVKTNLDKNKKNLKYQTVIIRLKTVIWPLRQEPKKQCQNVSLSTQERVKILKSQFGLMGYIWIFKTQSLSSSDIKNIFMPYQLFLPIC